MTAAFRFKLRLIFLAVQKVIRELHWNSMPMSADGRPLWWISLPGAIHCEPGEQWAPSLIGIHFVVHTMHSEQ